MDFDMNMERLTADGPEGVIVFCHGCSDRPIIGKCDLASACYARQVFLRLRELEVKIKNGELIEHKPKKEESA